MPKKKNINVNVPQIKNHDKPQIDIPKELNKEKKVKINEIFDNSKNQKIKNKKIKSMY